MKEKEIIKSQQFNIKKILLGIGLLAIIILLIIWFENHYIANPKYEWQEVKYSFGNAIYHLIPFTTYTGEFVTIYESLEQFWLPLIIILSVLITIYKWLAKMEIVVTDKRVYGKTAFGKRVDLPLDSISAISISFLKGIAIGTSSGKVNFKFIKNNQAIHKEVSTLLLKRQQKSSDNLKEVSCADELEKYKKLLDSGAIMKKQYNKKKKELLKL